MKWKNEDMYKLDTPFANLPFLKDGDFILTESDAMAEYIAFKY
jgi:glutathione S-transferase